MLETLGAIAATGLSLVLPAPVVAVASDGPWVSVAVGRSAHDCDRVSIWNTYVGTAPTPKLFRLGRKTSCATPAGRIAALSEIDNRALWLHVAGEATRTWTLWTATTTSTSPKLLARVVRGADEPAPIVVGPGNKDRRQLVFGEGDVLPYAVGRRVTVLRGNGSKALSWTAPSDVTALGSDPGLLVVAVADGTVFLWEYSPDSGWGQIDSYPGSPAATRVFWGGLSLYAQRGDRLDNLHTESAGCSGARALRPGERLRAASGGRIVLGTGTEFRVLPGCRGGPVTTGVATSLALDGARLTYALDRRVTTRFIPG